MDSSPSLWHNLRMHLLIWLIFFRCVRYCQDRIYMKENSWKIYWKNRKSVCHKYIVEPSVQQENNLNNNIFLFIVKLLLVMIEYNFRSVYYIRSKP